MRSDLAERIGTRTGSTTNSVAQTYPRDGAYVTDPVLKDSSATYTPGVSEKRGTATTFLHSGLKNADTQTGTAQTVSATRRYDAFGNVVTSSGIWNGPFGYAGGFGYQEDATGLKLLGHRYYDSSTGRFLTRDPQKDGRNWYTYCWNDPISWMDADGQAPDGTFDPFNPNYFAPHDPPRLRYPVPGGKDEKKPPATGGGKKAGGPFKGSQHEGGVKAGGGNIDFSQGGGLVKGGIDLAPGDLHFGPGFSSKGGKVDSDVEIGFPNIGIDLSGRRWGKFPLGGVAVSLGYEDGYLDVSARIGGGGSNIGIGGSYKEGKDGTTWSLGLTIWFR